MNKLSNYFHIFTLTLILLIGSQNTLASDTRPEGPFIQVNSLAELKERVNKSINEKKPVLIYFYATWCHFCQAVNRNVFADSTVQKSLNGITAIAVNSSDNTTSQVEMMDRYGVQVFPTIIFYNRSGSLIEPAQFQSGINKDKMLAVLKEIKE